MLQTNHRQSFHNDDVLQVILDTVTKVGGTADYCLGHLLLARDIGCVEGLGNLNGVCKRHSNTAWTKADMYAMFDDVARNGGHNIQRRRLLNAKPTMTVFWLG